MSGRPGVDEATYLGAIRVIGGLLIAFLTIEFFQTLNPIFGFAAVATLALVLLAGLLKEEALKAGEIRAITKE